MTPEQFDAILADVAAGEPTHRAVESRGLNRRTFYALLASDEDAANKYARAKARGCEAHAAEIVEIADQDPKTVEIKDADGNVIEVKIDTAFEAWRKTRIDARKWTLSKLLPKVYGDKMELDAKVSVGDAIVERLARARGEKAAA